ncbi:hypothetical protein L484_007666 [Morus notabilis]|uniref:Uncharacterized protein n=1 Tax=Morus notabilis TaxID=981085 RepID=W9R6I0_9ROSA|nr:hypothetical protein L484_007666 [Morus notabilis]
MFDGEHFQEDSPATKKMRSGLSPILFVIFARDPNIYGILMIYSGIRFGSYGASVKSVWIAGNRREKFLVIRQRQ